MSEEYVIVNKSTLTSIADEVRNIDGSSNSFFPTQIASTLSNVNSSIGAALLALTGNKISTLSVNVADGQFYHYRAKMTDVDGRNAYSDAAMLSVAGYVAIVKQPVDAVAKVGDTVTHSVVAAGDGLTYLWQYSNDGGATWNNCSSAGYNTANFTFTAHTQYDGWYHRCIITDSHGNSVTTNVVVTKIGEIGIRTQPVDIVAAESVSVAFTVDATGVASYQWQVTLNNGLTWNDSSAGGNKTNTFSISVTTNKYDYLYRCKLTGEDGSVLYTNNVRILKPSAVAITTQPVSVEANIGNTATFTIEADNVATYQWQVSTDSGTTWQNISLADEKYTANSSNTVHDMAGMIEDLTAGSENSELARKIIDRSITEIEDSSITRLGDYAFAGCYSLTTANFPTCTTIGSNAFYSCTNLTFVSFPKCTSIKDYAFTNCHSLTFANFPECTSLEMGAFYSCYSLASANFPKCTYLRPAAFCSCSNLTSINFPKCTYIEMQAFYKCSNLISISFPECTHIGNYAFNGCSSLTTIILGYSSIVKLNHSNAFYSTPMSTSSYTGTYGSIYVPASLVSAYQSATNWSYYSSRITSITT